MFKIAKQVYHFVLAWMGAIIYRHPSRKLFVIGVTGTKGKSTTIELINAALEAVGGKTAISSSVRIKTADDSRVNDSGNTMPGRFFLQRFLRKAVNAGCNYALIEVTSEGVRQYRHRFIDFDAAVFTNLHPEHIESHGSFEKYREAKLSFFRDLAKFSRKSPKYFFVNGEDENAKYFIAASGGKAIIYSKKDVGSYEFSPALLGDFNRENTAAAIAVLKVIGVSDAFIKEIIKNFRGVPGRMEFVASKPFAVVVDYAHTPDSLENVYRTIKYELKPRNLICVLGSAGGGRDKWKRPKFGEIASRYCDKIILTNEDPFDEDPEQILSEIKSGITSPKFLISNVSELIDRREAISKAVMMAGAGDAVIITGKGSEPYIRVAHCKRIPWSDKKVVEEVLKQKQP
jgi:UDP-N-acetylmuramoyl-L-alanyl-D-glutamate--2,6-diaminopimelate ligase